MRIIQGLIVNDDDDEGQINKSNEISKSNRRKKEEMTVTASSGPVTSPGGGVIRNVGPRLAKDLAAKKEVKKEKKLKERKEKKESKKNGRPSVGSNGGTRFEDLHCSYCNVTFYNRSDFQNHCRSDRHQHTIMSDEGITKLNLLRTVRNYL
jgi:hypothetical protein